MTYTQTQHPRSTIVALLLAAGLGAGTTNAQSPDVITPPPAAQPDSFPTKEDLGLAASHLAFAAEQNNDPATALQALEIRDKLLPQSPSSLFIAATAHDKLHQAKQAVALYKQFLSVANGKFPNEEWEARHRLVTLEHMK